MLRLDTVTSGYGPIIAVKSVSLAVGAGELVTVIGPNGAGKSTLLRTIMGLLPCRTGSIRLDDQPVQTLSTQERVRRGISLVPEGREIFGPLTVFENLELGAYHRFRRVSRQELASDFADVFHLFPILAERRRQPAGTLSGGEQQMLAIGRALMAKPRVLLLDEPSLGLAPMIVEQIFGVLRQLNSRGLTMLLVEQNVHLALAAARRGYVLRTGEVVASDTADRLQAAGEIERAYLGLSSSGRTE